MHLWALQVVHAAALSIPGILPSPMATQRTSPPSLHEMRPPRPRRAVAGQPPSPEVGLLMLVAEAFEEMAPDPCHDTLPLGRRTLGRLMARVGAKTGLCLAPEEVPQAVAGGLRSLSMHAAQAGHGGALAGIALGEVLRLLCVPPWNMLVPARQRRTMMSVVAAYERGLQLVADGPTEVPRAKAQRHREACWGHDVVRSEGVCTSMGGGKAHFPVDTCASHTCMPQLRCIPCLIHCQALRGPWWISALSWQAVPSCSLPRGPTRPVTKTEQRGQRRLALQQLGWVLERWGIMHKSSTFTRWRLNMSQQARGKPTELVNSMAREAIHTAKRHLAGTECAPAWSAGGDEPHAWGSTLRRLMTGSVIIAAQEVQGSTAEAAPAAPLTVTPAPVVAAPAAPLALTPAPVVAATGPMVAPPVPVVAAPAAPLAVTLARLAADPSPGPVVAPPAPVAVTLGAVVGATGPMTAAPARLVAAPVAVVANPELTVHPEPTHLPSLEDALSKLENAAVVVQGQRGREEVVPAGVVGKENAEEATVADKGADRVVAAPQEGSIAAGGTGVPGEDGEGADAGDSPTGKVQMGSESEAGAPETGEAVHSDKVEPGVGADLVGKAGVEEALGQAAGPVLKEAGDATEEARTASVPPPAMRC